MGRGAGVGTAKRPHRAGAVQSTDEGVGSPCPPVRTSALAAVLAAALDAALDAALGCSQFGSPLSLRSFGRVGSSVSA